LITFRRPNEKPRLCSWLDIRRKQCDALPSAVRIFAPVPIHVGYSSLLIDFAMNLVILLIIAQAFPASLMLFASSTTQQSFGFVDFACLGKTVASCAVTPNLNI
jgi:hypothetical protein